MNDIDKLFFELIRVAFGNAVCLSHTPTNAEWKTLYELAKKQSLVGICFAGVQRLQGRQQAPPEMIYLQWMGMAAKIQQRNEVVNQQCVDLQKRLSADGFRSYIMKGQGNAVLYGDLNMLRQSGDIDIYLEGGFNKVLTYANTFAPTKEVNELEMHVNLFSDTDVEFHYRPFIMRNPFKNRKLQRFFTEEGERCFDNQIELPNGLGTIAAPTLEFNLVHQMMHIYHHLFTEGIGLRQLMDYYFLLRSVKSVETVKESKKCILNLGLERFASALIWVLSHVFGDNSVPEFVEGWKPNENDGKFLLNEIMMAGNFGHHDERVPKNMSYWKSFWYLNFHNLRLLRFDKWSWFWTPIMRMKWFLWRKKNGFK